MASAIPAQIEGYRREIVALARTLLWDRGDLGEALQSILGQSPAALSQGAEADVRRWLLRLTVLTVHGINRKRRPKRGPAGEPEVDLSDELRLEESYRHLLRNPEQVVSNLGLPLRNALAQLGELDRAVFLLRSMCDLKYQEISDVLDVPIGTVMGSLVRSRIHLRKSLAEQIHEV
jgi:RNA polymerase sigma-70 factor (ECF subfamily)